MAIKIAHFSIDEKGKISGGASGDQTGKECCIRDWYNKPWDYYIEITDEALANKAADLFTQVANRNEAGYDQGQRLTFYEALVACKGDVTKLKPSEADCSSGISSIYKFLGLGISQACTTRNIRAALVKTGRAKVYSDKEHTASDKYAKRGGIYLKEGSHAVMAIENGSAYKPAPTPVTPQPAPQPVPAPSNKVIGTAVAKGSMKVRSVANTGLTSKVIGYVSKGNTVEVLEVLSNGWYKIVWKNGIGYTSNAGNKYYTYTAKQAAPAPVPAVPATPGVIKAGTKYVLNNVPVYTSETGKIVGKRSGTYYIWSDTVKNNRVRMTNRLDRVGVNGQVSFFVDVNSLK